MNKAALIRKYGESKAWERAGLYYLDPPMKQRNWGGGYDDVEYVLVTIQGDTVDMLSADHKGRLTDGWLPMCRETGEERGLFNVTPLSCTGALEAEGYTVVTLGEMTA